jgi:CubicO group peptidase (beta-lactamase class C family)
MRIFGKVLIWIIGLSMLVMVLLAVFDAFYLLKAVRITYLNGHKTAFLDDYKYFKNDTIEAGTAQPWLVSSRYNQTELSRRLADSHARTGTVAFLVIRNDSILHESYYDGYDRATPSNSFSMAKSIVAAAAGKAILEGKIKGLSQPVYEFFPEFNKGRASRMTVGDLAAMSSGLSWDENYYSPFSITTRAYFDEHVDELILDQTAIEEPGKKFKYLSGNTQLLAMVVEVATGQKLTQYVSEKFWKPMGAEYPAYWQTDRDGGMIKAYCCVGSNARDFARFGKLFLNNGKWNGEVILDSSFVAKSVQPQFNDSPQYGLSWWLFEYKGKKGYYMRGHLGQYTIVIPQENLIIVRLGHRHKRSTRNNPHSDDFWVIIEEVLKSIESKN